MLSENVLNIIFTSNFCRFQFDESENMDGRATVVPRNELMNVRAVTQLEKDTILVCYDSKFVIFVKIFIVY